MSNHQNVVDATNVQEKKPGWIHNCWNLLKEYSYETVPGVFAHIVITPFLVARNVEIGSDSKNAIQIISETINERGFLSLWHTLPYSLFQNFVKLPSIVHTKLKKHYIGEHPEEIPYNKRISLELLSLAIPSVITMTLQYPVRVIRTRLDFDQSTNYTGFLDCVSKMWSESKLITFFQGYSTNLILLLAKTLMHGVLKEAVKVEFNPKGFQKFASLVVIDTLLAGITYPLLVIGYKNILEGMPLGNGETQAPLGELTLRESFKGVFTEMTIAALHSSTFMGFYMAYDMYRKSKKKESQKNNKSEEIKPL